MYAIEFQANIDDGIIEIPVAHREALLSKIKGSPVRIIVLAPEAQEAAATIPEQKDLAQDFKEKGYDSFIDYLLDNPVRIPNMTYLTSDEANAR